jgi:hypothetical protein
MKQTLTIVLCCLAIAMTAQPINSDQVNYILAFENEKGETPQNQEVTAININDKTEIHSMFTSEKGKVKFILKRGETYKIQYLTESFEATIPGAGTSFLTKKIILKNSLNIGKTASSDTIIFKKTPTKPTETEALFQLILKDKDGKLLPNLTVWLVQPKIQKTYQATTNTKGEAFFLLPIDYDYTVNFLHDANYKTITVPKMPNLRFKKGFTYTSNFMEIQETEQNDTIFQIVSLSQKPTPKRTLILVTVLDLDGNPLENENVYLQGIKKVYTAKTDAKGETALMLPKGAFYAVNFEFRDSLEILNIEAGNYTRTDKIRYKYIGSKAIKTRILERQYYEALWDSLAQVQAFRDSLAAARSPYSNFSYRFRDANLSDLNGLIQKRAAEDLKQLRINPKYFVEVGDEAAAALYRNKDKWDDKLIITDLTCSMHPYLDQILSWHVLELQLKKNKEFENQYMFFNDGDGKSMAEKIIGLTGGFHYTNAVKLEDLTQTMKETMSTGCSIDGPENDLEALLDGVQNRKLRKMEIILIADNNSEIRDFELLKSLNVPIRVILAGTFWGVNEQYLELAYHTHGSVHTIEEDLERLYEMNDGDYIEIGGNKYRIYGGKFLKMDRM